MKQVFAAIALALATFSASAAIKTQTVEYKQGDATLEGFLAYDDSASGSRPGVLIVHQWKGISAHEKETAEKLAKMGYVVFAADIYGKGIRPQPPESAQEAGKYKSNRALFRERLNAGLDQLKKQKGVDQKKLAAIGYCFGGTGVIELARSGADVAGVVSFHGGLDSPKPEDGKNIKARVLALHGADDPFVPAKDLEAFQKEMRDAKVDWQLISYGNAVHSFTHKDAGSDNSKGAAYNANADRRSWEDMKDFFAEIFGTAK